MSIVARFFPNGEFTHGVDTARRRKERPRKERRHEKIAPESKDGYLQWVQDNPNADINLYSLGQSFISADGNRFWTYLGEYENHHHYSLECTDGASYQDVIMDFPIARMVGDGQLIPLGSSNSRILKKPSSRKTCLTMTKHLARNIRNAAYLMERDYGKDNLSFLTLTIPGINEESLSSICANWDKIVHRFFMWLRAKLQSKNIKPSWVYCTEIQTSRLKMRGEYAPHLHILFRGRNARKNPWAITPKMARKAWIRCIQPYINCSFDDRAVENIQRIKRSACGYLSKYMSKGANSIPSMDDSSSPIASLKTHWGGMSRDLSKALKAATRVIRGDGENGAIISCFIRKIQIMLQLGYIKYYKSGIIQVSRDSGDGEERGLKVGCGCLFSPLCEGGLSACLQVAYILHECQL